MNAATSVNREKTEFKVLDLSHSLSISYVLFVITIKQRNTYYLTFTELNFQSKII